ncbi:hypothetical protein [Nocardioides litoris]|uniref:hypothetical protein n=1 Tax=Nocardioides litoris TaxID=1926648 RepID=UPI001121D17B|nr:hypothetical protein [Nocardioides litoris]
MPSSNCSNTNSTAANHVADVLNRDGFADLIAVAWALLLPGQTPTQVLTTARKWKAFGFDDTDAVDWHRAGLTPDSGWIWYHVDFTPRGAAFMIERITAGDVDDTAQTWVVGGLLPSDILLAVASGCRTVEAAQRLIRDIDAGARDRGTLVLRAAVSGVDLPALTRR